MTYYVSPFYETPHILYHTRIKNLITQYSYKYQMIRLLIPILWPHKNLRIKLLVCSSFLTVTVGCLINFYVPICAQKIVDNLNKTVENKSYEICWKLVLIFVALKMVQGAGALSLMSIFERMTWLSIDHHLRHHIQVKFLRHIHSMSLSWLMEAKIADILGALEIGTDSLSSTLEHILFSVIPTLADIIIAIFYLSFKFGWIYGLITGLQILFYLLLTSFAIEKHASYQSVINKRENELRHKSMESILNFETVRSFGNEEFEKNNYAKRLRKLQGRKWNAGLLISLLQTFQQVIVCVGLLALSLLTLASVVYDRKLSAEDYVLCTMFLGQLYGPLNYLAGYYRELRVNLVNTESMTRFLNNEPEIKDSPGAKDLHVEQGAIQFKNVCLAGDSGEMILSQISFSVAPKTTVALVGCTGSGKTSILRLLLRLFEPTSGKILVDGVNVKNVTLESLRKSFGIIPQDISLFDDTIGNNIRYGDLTANDFDVAFAASLAGIHGQILKFPDGYETNVGVRGSRLSGGQRQLIAISRAILQNPKILILDESCSALDVTSEKHIQQVVSNLCKNRTCLIVTHNLIWTVSVDSIIVLKNGRIVERGSHSTLLKKDGHFAAMWKEAQKIPNRTIKMKSS